MGFVTFFLNVWCLNVALTSYLNTYVLAYLEHSFSMNFYSWFECFWMLFQHLRRLISASYAWVTWGMMLDSASSVNHAINTRNTAAVTTMAQILDSAASFNQSINTRNTAAFTTMASMLDSASSFNRASDTRNSAAVTTTAQMLHSWRGVRLRLYREFQLLCLGETRSPEHDLHWTLNHGPSHCGDRCDRQRVEYFLLPAAVPTIAMTAVLQRFA
jgi:hypothetical protein